MTAFPDTIFEPRQVVNKSGVTYVPEKANVFFAEDINKATDEIVAIETLLFGVPNLSDAFSKIWTNIMLGFFKLSVLGGLVKFNLIDGFVDEYEDESGVDLVNSVSEYYNSTDDYFYSVAVDLGTGLISRWKMNDNANNSTVVDDVGGHNGALVDGSNNYTSDHDMASGNPPSLNGALDFDGNDSVAVANNDVFNIGSGPFSLSVWVKADNPTVNADGVIAKDNYSGTTTYNGFLLNVQADNKWAFQTRKKVAGVGPSTVVFSQNPASTGWVHLVAVREGNSPATLSLYVNGVLQNTAVEASETNINNLSALYIGMLGPTPPQYFDGVVDEVRFYNIALNQEKVTALYNSGVGTEVVSVGGNMTLISVATVAEYAPSEARIVIFEEDVDAVTLNTDIKAFVSRDGVNYTEITLTDEGDYETGKRVISGLVDITSASGTNIKYKIQTFNSKSLKIHGTAVQWS